MIAKTSEEVPKQGWAAVVVDEGQDFRIEVQKLDVPEPSKSLPGFDPTL